MVKITEKEVKRLAGLAMLSLTDDEVSNMSKELENIFTMIEEINAFDTTEVEETAQVTGLKHVTRDDIEKKYDVSARELLKEVPKSKDNSIEVPSVQ